MKASMPGESKMKSRDDLHQRRKGGSDSCKSWLGSWDTSQDIQDNHRSHLPQIPTWRHSSLQPSYPATRAKGAFSFSLSLV